MFSDTKSNYIFRIFQCFRLV